MDARRSCTPSELECIYIEGESGGLRCRGISSRNGENMRERELKSVCLELPAGFFLYAYYHRGRWGFSLGELRFQLKPALFDEHGGMRKYSVNYYRRWESHVRCSHCYHQQFHYFTKIEIKKKRGSKRSSKNCRKYISPEQTPTIVHYSNKHLGSAANVSPPSAPK